MKRRELKEGGFGPMSRRTSTLVFINGLVLRTANGSVGKKLSIIKIKS